MRRAACALFGCGRKEEGYEYLERTFGLFQKWDLIPEGAEMEVGHPLLYGGIKAVKGKGVIVLPDGTKESFDEAGPKNNSCKFQRWRKM